MSKEIKMSGSSLPVSPAPYTNEYPLSIHQEDVWRLNQIERDNPACRQAVALSLSGAVNADIVHQTLQEIIKRQTVLGAIFKTVNGEPRQSILSDIYLEQAYEVDLRDVPDDEKQTELEWLIVEAREEPFDLAQGPLIRSGIFQLDDNEYMLLLIIHRLLFDEWSVDLLIKEFATIYEALTKGEEYILPELAIQYKDYAYKQRQLIEAGAWGDQINYWLGKFIYTPENLDLPTDRPRADLRTFQGAQQKLEISSGLSQELEHLSLRENVSLNATLLAVFKILLYLYTGKYDIVVGTSVSGRTQTELEPLIGCFTNNLAIRSDLSGNPSFLSFLPRLSATMREAYKNQDIPFSEVVHALKLERASNQSPLFQVLFNFTNLAGYTAKSQHLEIKTFEFDSSVSTYEWEVKVNKVADRLCVNFIYNTELFESATIKQALAYYQALLESIVYDPEIELSKLLLLADSKIEKGADHNILICPDNPFVEFAKTDIESSIVKRFERQAARFPAKLALRTKNETCTYEQLNRRSNQVAHMILTKCGADHQRVALLFKQEASMITGLLGALKAGKTYIPLDIPAPEHRLNHVLADGKVGALVTNAANISLAKRLDSGPAAIINIDEITADVSYANPNLTIAPDAPAYIIYTSGSTGKPKGVVQNHRNVLHFIRAYANHLHIGSEDNLSLLSGYSFDAAVMDIYGALLNGATLCLFNLKEEGLGDLADRLRSERVTIYHSTPTVYRYFIDTLTADEMFPLVRLVVLGGEQVYKRDVDAFKMHFESKCLFVNLLGSTESSLNMINFLNRDTILPGTTVPVGKPVVETEIVLLNDRGEEVPLYGEIGIKSAYVALEYWRQPELSQAAFKNDAVTGKRIYRTGDLGRRLPDGGLECRGRKDFQVKIRGYRVEIGEIEAILSEHKQIAKCVVTATQTEMGEQSLIAYYIARTMTLPPDSNELMHFLKEKLPDYMIPAKFILMDSFPLTPTGKVDRRQLMNR